MKDRGILNLIIPGLFLIAGLYLVGWLFTYLIGVL